MFGVEPLPGCGGAVSLCAMVSSTMGGFQSRLRLKLRLCADCDKGGVVGAPVALHLS